ncbi:MAG: hypothetical protein GTO18_05355 [Anaerolineales bacterium]|nr:hypothetical protein [Anaerolineales bacterium]
MFHYIWIFFMAAFFYLAYASWRNSKVTIRPFTIRNGPEDEDEEEVSEAFKLVEGFIKDFNKYLEIVNDYMNSQNVNYTLIFFLSGLASFIAFVLGVFGITP